MLVVYNIMVHIAAALLRVLAVFSPKLKLFVNGRKTVFSTLAHHIAPSDKTIWFHAASLGEYEQGIPVMEAVKTNYPNHKIVLTFFSPSGFEVRKNNTLADVTVYLPMDTRQNAKQFVKLVHPEWVFFIKYEYWPNYLNELKNKNTKTYLISGVFRKNQAFFKWYGGFYRKALTTFQHFFVQNQSSAQLIQSLGYTNVTLAGDTRFDRVAAILERDNTLDFIEQFKNNKTTIVIGSSWPKDEDLLVHYINNASEEIKFIIAPHNIHKSEIVNLQSLIQKKVVLFSEKSNVDLSKFNVFIIDTIGILTKIYSYADIAYVGGGFGNPGVHNLLEPATFGIPIVIGPNYSHFAEATALVDLGGCTSIKNQEECNQALNQLIHNENLRREKGRICVDFVQNHKGATAAVMHYLLNENLK